MRTMVAAAVLEGLAAAQTNALDQFVGRDLWKERLSSKEQLILNELVGDVPNGFLANLRLGTSGKRTVMAKCVTSSCSSSGRE